MAITRIPVQNKTYNVPECVSNKMKHFEFYSIKHIICIPQNPTGQLWKYLIALLNICLTNRKGQYRPSKIDYTVHY